MRRLEGKKSLFARLRALNERTRDTYEGSDIDLARRFGFVLWPAGCLVMTILLVFFPPTKVVGAWGWLVPLTGLGAVIAALLYARRRPERITYGFLYVSGYFGLVSISVTQWLAGGRAAPFHELFLLQVIGNGLMHPPRRFALFMLALTGAMYAPLFYAPGSALPGEIATELCLWTGIGAFLVAFLRRIRAQRVALRQAGEEAHQLARVDALTGLANRRAFDEDLEAQLEDARVSRGHVSLIVCDLNGFKRINDVHGHVAGDDCLRQAAAALRSTVRDGDGCYRWGGDEFAVLVANAAEGDAANLADRIAKAVATSCRAPDGLPLTVACGPAEIPGDATASEAVAAADAVLLSLKSRAAATRA
jgi:diguanylate cyclase (GGDEF)-like protein